MKSTVINLIALLVVVVIAMLLGNILIDKYVENKKPRLNFLGLIEQDGMYVKSYELKTQNISCIIVTVNHSGVNGNIISVQPVCH